MKKKKTPIRVIAPTAVENPPNSYTRPSSRYWRYGRSSRTMPIPIRRQTVNLAPDRPFSYVTGVCRPQCYRSYFSQYPRIKEYFYCFMALKKKNHRLYRKSNFVSKKSRNPKIRIGVFKQYPDKMILTRIYCYH